MECTTCGHQTIRVGRGWVFWCPQCGTITPDAAVLESVSPYLVQRALDLCDGVLDYIAEITAYMDEPKGTPELERLENIVHNCATRPQDEI